MMEFAGRCVGGKSHNEWVVCEAPYFRTVIFPELAVSFDPSSEVSASIEYSYEEYEYDSRDCSWRLR